MRTDGETGSPGMKRANLRSICEKSNSKPALWRICLSFWAVETTIATSGSRIEPPGQVRNGRSRNGIVSDGGTALFRSVISGLGIMTQIESTGNLVSDRHHKFFRRIHIRPIP